MNGCGFCGAVPSEQAPICPTCDSELEWVEQHLGRGGPYSPRQQGWFLPSWVWLCQHQKSLWHEDAESLLKWAKKCPNVCVRDYAITKAKSIRQGASNAD